ncbi:Calx-beta domain-containing protein [Anatilimnocola aggregata]|nr:Calx-beta domain-containing protein [Anatilimnocola aggregata]
MSASPLTSDTEGIAIYGPVPLAESMEVCRLTEALLAAPGPTHEDSAHTFPDSNHSAAGLLATGRIYDDANGNSVLDLNERSLPNAKIYADLNNNLVQDVNEPFGYSGAEGVFGLFGVPAGVYPLRVDRPGWETTQEGHFDSQELGNILLGIHSTADLPVGNVSGTIFRDLNLDGLRNPNEVGLRDRTVYADDNENGIADPSETSARTDAAGNYELQLTAGEHLVREVGNASDPILVTLAEGETTACADIAIRPGGALAGSVYHDRNASGMRDRDEEALPGQVYLDINQNCQFDAGEAFSDVDSNGAFQFADISAGEYILRALFAPGTQVSEGASGQMISLSEGDEIRDILFGGYRNASISGLVVHDYNTLWGNGVAGQQVFVDVNDNGNLDFDEPVAISDENGGFYTLEGLTPGVYQLRLANTAGWHATDESRGEAVTVTSGEVKTINPLRVQPGLEILDAQVSEGSEATGYATFVVHLQTPVEVPITVSFKTSAALQPTSPATGIAKAGQDYLAGIGTLTFAPGEQSKSIRVRVLGDTVAENDEQFIVQLQNPRGATLIRNEATGSIIDDDAAAQDPSGTPAIEPCVTGEIESAAPVMSVASAATSSATLNLKGVVPSYNPNGGTKKILGGATLTNSRQITASFRADFYWSSIPSLNAGARSELIGSTNIAGKSFATGNHSIGFSLNTQRSLVKPAYAKYLVQVLVPGAGMQESTYLDNVTAAKL